MWSYRHQSFTVHQLAVLRDNYIYLIEAHKSDALIVVDPAVAADVIIACKTLGKKLTHVFNTHHHWDHTDGNLSLKQAFDCLIVGAQHDAKRIPCIDIKVNEQQPPDIAGLNIQVIDVPGHTLGHIAFVLDDALFCGDTLFGGGCGRLFEGTPAQMLHSLDQLAALDGNSKIYCAHEYTLANLAFAQTIDPDNNALSKRIQNDQARRQQQQPTIPSSMTVELATNPMLRPLHNDFCLAYAKRNQLEKHDALTVFSDIRLKKDHW